MTATDSSSMSTGAGCNCWRRAKASSRRTSSVPCSAARRVMPRILRWSSASGSAALDQAEPAEHRGEQIVEIVRDAAGQLADRVHLARLEQLVLEVLAVGDVEQRAGEFDRAGHRRRAAARPDRGNGVPAVGALPAIFDRERARRASRSASAAARCARSSGWSRSAHRPGFAQQFVDAKPVIAWKLPLTKLRHARRAVAYRFEIEHDRQRLDDRGLALLGQTQFLLDPEPFGVGRAGWRRAAPARASALRWISRVIANRSTKTATLERRTTGRPA